MGIIQPLPPELISRIAAGECVERPASVVKELVENALDAGATRIDVNILDGGRGLISVSDDGAGMAPEDLPLAIAQHATSKLRSQEDLFGVHTLGFRGEALASIASVSRLSLTSRRRESDVGCQIRVEGGEVGRTTPCAAPPGTTVEVRDLFYAVPARRRFLKTNQTEMSQITEQFARIALSFPGVSLSLRHNERVVHRLAAVSDRRQRIADFFGPELAAGLLPVQRAGGGLRLDGLIAPPAESRGSGKWEYIFVNGRFIRDRFVGHAVKESYRSLIDPSRFPVVFLYLTIEPADVDVNVHPTKIEVRWRDSNFVHGQVLAALREKFLSTNLDHRFRTHGLRADAPDERGPAGSPHAEDAAYRDRVRQAMVDFFHGGGRERAAPHGAAAGPTPRADFDRTADPAAHGPPAGPAAPESAPRLAPAPAETAPPPAAAPADALTPAQVARRAAMPRWRAAQFHNTFLVVETDEGLLIIDQHALHERILYEELRARFTSRTLAAQRLLLPEIVRVPPDRLAALEAHAETLARLGVELAPAGPQAVALHAFPTLLHQRADAPRFVRDLLDLLAEHGARPQADTLIHGVLDMMACKAAVKAGDPLTPDEIEALLARREAAERSSHCPHGRPTTLHLTLRDLERQFRRR